MFIQRGYNNFEIKIEDAPSFLNTYSLDFDGVDDKVELGTQSLGITAAISVSAWVKIPTTNTGGAAPYIQNIVVEDAAGGTARNWTLYWRGGTNLDGFSAGIFDSSGAAHFVNSATPTPNDNQWHHLMFTYTGISGANNLTLFVDGISVGTATSLAGGLRATSSVIPTIGGLSGSNQRMFEGNIDEVAIFDTDQSANASTIYNDGIPNNLTDLSPLHWYRNGDNGAYKSPQWLIPSNENKDKVSNYSFAFDGIDDKVSLTSLIPLGLISISFWMKSTHSSGNDSITSGLGNLGFIGTTPLVVLSGVNYRYFANQASKFDGEWHHWFLLIAGSGQSDITNSRLFVDGVEISSGTTINSGTPSSWTNSQIGRGNYGYLNCSINNFAVWEGSDESANVSTIYNNGTPNDISSLSPTAWLKMGEDATFTSNWLVDNSALDNYSKRSFEFDGVGDYISVSNNSIGQTQNISYSIWVNLDVTSRQYIIGNQTSSNGGCGLQIESGDVLLFQMADGGNDSFFNSRVANFSTYAPINTWNHILATWDGTDSKIYINGVLRNTWNPTLPYTISNYSTFWIARRAANTLNTVNGKVDEIALFDSGVSIGDVWDGSGQPIDVSSVSGITNNWRMGEDASFNGTNWNVPDNVGSNNGTSANMTVDDLLGEAPNYSGGGISNGMTIEDRIGNAPNSENNALSYNMDKEDRVEDTP